MRPILITAALVFLATACGEDETPPTADPAPVAPPAAPAPGEPAPNPTAAPVPAPAPSAATTEGFIEVDVDGETRRFDYMAAEDNTATPRVSRVRARSEAGTEHGVQLLLVGVDVRTVEYPTTFARQLPRRGHMTIQMPAVEYWDEQGTRYVTVNARIPCQSFEDLLLTCTLPDFTLNDQDGNGSRHLTNGRVQVHLTTDAAHDAAQNLLGNAVGQPVMQ